MDAEAVAAGTVLGMLGVLMTHFLRRTKDTDELQVAAVNSRVEAAEHNEARAWAEVKRVETERDAAIARADRLQEQLDTRRGRR